MLKQKKLKALHSKFYNKTRLNYPNMSLYDLIEKTAQKYPNNIAYNYFGKKSNYQNLIKEIEKCAKSLKSMGIRKGDVVTICMPNTPEAIFTFYAVNKIGAIANMIHPLSAENEIKYYLEISDSKMLITIDLAWNKIENILNNTKVEKTVVLSVKKSMPIFLKTIYGFTKERKIKMPKYNENILNWDKFIEKGASYKKETNAHTQANDTAAILYSGGTTGLSKGIILSNLNFNAIAIQNLTACPLKSTDKCLSIMPIFHGFGLRNLYTYNFLFRSNSNYTAKF